MPIKNADNHRLGSILQKIYNIDVALEPDHLSKKQVLSSFLTNFNEYCLQKSPVYKKYFNGFYFTGSYFEGLRVKQATEFDINVGFDFPFSDLKYEICELDFLPSYATVQLKSQTDSKNIPFFDDERYLVKENILKWFQSLLDSFLNSQLLTCSGVLWIKSSNSGPARTVKILYKSVWISIDLVPVFSLKLEYLRKFDCLTECLPSSRDMSICYIVPKPLKPEVAELIPKDMSSRAWRVNFPEAEKSILKNKKNLKRVIQLAKALRDKEDWPIPSYFLKVVAIWLLKNHSEAEFWKKKNIGCLFLCFLEAFENHLRTQFLGHIFYPKFNLFDSLHPSLLRNVKIRVRKIIQLLKKEPTSAFMLFKIMHIPHASLAPSLFIY